jgi:uncharacterized 2Fe-2S/4Fe-4S cluster protein (DUF4445 family)
MRRPDELELLTVDFQPVGRRSQVAAGATVLEAARSVGLGVVSLCGGDGWCGSCRVRLADGRLSELTSAEREALSEEEVAAGYRLACQAVPQGDVKIEVPPDSLSTPQRLQTEGQDVAVELAPAVRVAEVQMPPPTLHDLRSDTDRLQDAHGSLRFDHAVLTDISERLRGLDWRVRLVLRGDELVALLPPDAIPYGLAVDIGTTKLAAYLVRLDTGETVAKLGAMNPQIAYGEDVVSRIAYTHEHPDGRQVLQERVVGGLNQLVGELCASQDIPPDRIVDAVVVGNTVMHHLFAGLPVSQLGRSPYVPAVGGPLLLRASDVGLGIAPAASVYLPPNIAGYVGADHVAVILATGIWQERGTVIAVDVGTNTEITLAHGGRLLSCSCASGPAFEGAHIRDGMRAAAGAIERVQVVDRAVRFSTIDDQPPVGICGSGILDAVAEMLGGGIMDERGALDEAHPLTRPGDRLTEFVLVAAEQTGHGRDILLTRKDVSEIQLAKAAIRVGLDTLMAEAGLQAAELEAFIVAGAFGTYISIPSAIRIGMFPAIPLERYRQVGNAAGMGAKQLLLSAPLREKALQAAQRVEYIELTTHPDFQRSFVQRMYLNAD